MAGSGGGELGGWEERTSTVSSEGLGTGMVGMILVDAGWLVGLGFGTGSGAGGGFGAAILEKARGELGSAFGSGGSTVIGGCGIGGSVGRVPSRFCKFGADTGQSFRGEDGGTDAAGGRDRGPIEERCELDGGLNDVFRLAACSFGCTAFARTDSESEFGLDTILTSSRARSFAAGTRTWVWNPGDEQG